ncbi:MAG: efflux RND transporter periplasmic adaptor subunit [Calditrichaeota bacterium]|nr:efflux RND transporter periplasmic adaptor subunit [Calditrichota bacterium]
MKKIILWIVIVVIASVMAFRFLERHQAAADPTILEIQAAEGYPVEVESAAIKPFRLSRLYTGTLTGREEADIVPMVGEYIARVLVREGQRVTAGQIICELSKDNPSAGYRQAELALENAGRELQRIQTLFDKGAVARQMLDGITLQRDIAKRNFELSQRLLTLTTPIAGTVANLTAEAGKFAAPGMPLAKVIAADRLRATFEVPAVDRNEIVIGANCRITAAGATASGKVERIALSADQEGRAFTAWIKIDDAPDNLAFSPGLMADIEVFVFDVPQALVVAPEAILRRGDDYHLFIVDNGKAKLLPVEIGARASDAVWIRSGLEPGAQVVIAGADLLSDGAPIRISKRG